MEKRNNYILVAVVSAALGAGGVTWWSKRSSGKYVFATSIFEKSLSIKPNEHCREWTFAPDFIATHCTQERNSYICKGSIENFMLSVYGSLEECNQYLAHARKALGEN